MCLEYHIKNCKGPCEGHQDEETYNQYIQQIRQILNGDLRLPKQYFRERMSRAAQEQQYELAHQFKVKLDKLDEFQSKSTIVNANLTNIDVFAIASNEKSAFISYLKVMNGSIVLTQSVEVQKKLDEPDDEVLAPLVMQMREEFESESKEVPPWASASPSTSRIPSRRSATWARVSLSVGRAPCSRARQSASSA